MQFNSAGLLTFGKGVPVRFGQLSFGKAEHDREERLPLSNLESVEDSMKSTWDLLDELAIEEAVNRGLGKARMGKKFDVDIFRAVAVTELAKLREEIQTNEKVMI